MRVTIPLVRTSMEGGEGRGELRVHLGPCGLRVNIRRHRHLGLGLGLGLELRLGLVYLSAPF